MKKKTLLGLLLAGALMVAPLAGCSAGAADTPAAQTAQTGQTEQAADASFVFTDNGITASGAETGWSVEGCVLTISAAGTYTLSGSCAEGSVQVEKGVQGVRLVLNGLTLSGGGTAAILCGASSEVQIEAAAGTENVLSVLYSSVGYDADGSAYVMVARPAEKNMLMAEKVYVTTGVETDFEVEVNSDQLSEGDLIFDNPESVTEGMVLPNVG